MSIHSTYIFISITPSIYWFHFSRKYYVVQTMRYMNSNFFFWTLGVRWHVVLHQVTFSTFWCCQFLFKESWCSNDRYDSVSSLMTRRPGYKFWSFSAYIDVDPDHAKYRGIKEAETGWETHKMPQVKRKSIAMKV